MNSGHAEVRDRALLYYRLLHTSPADAEEVNARALLLARAEQCRAERDRLPNLVAVNFYGLGDVFEVVDVLNGVAP